MTPKTQALELVEHSDTALRVIMRRNHLLWLVIQPYLRVLLDWRDVGAVLAA